MKHPCNHKLALTAGLTCLTAATALAQFSPRNLAVLRAGDNSTNAWSTFALRQSPAFIDEFSPTNPIVISSANTGTNGPIFSVSLPINDPASVPPYVAMWFDGHDATEGNLSQSLDGGTLAFTGYGGDIGTYFGTPDNLTSYNRGICVIDVNGNASIPYEGQDWYGATATTPCNTRGVVSDDGTNNFWGCGSEDGVEWFNPSEQNPPSQIEGLQENLGAVKIINGTLYTSFSLADQVAQGVGQFYPPGIYDLADFSGNLTPLPETGGAAYLNLVVPASPDYPNVEGFDLSPPGSPLGNIAYMADDNKGISKYVEVAGNWVLACGFGFTNNEGTAGYAGCFGLVVDWTGSYPVVFATTTEGAGGQTDANRLIRIDDNYNFTDGQFHTNINVTTLATAWSQELAFRGLAWTPDARPAITSNPASQSVVSGTPAAFSVTATRSSAAAYYWLVNGALDPSQTGATYSVSSASVSGTYQVVVSNSFGAVTSTVANLTVTPGPVAPSLVSPVTALAFTNAVYDTITIPVTVAGTTPLSYQWWQVTGAGATHLINGGDFSGAGTATLSVNVSSTADAGNYYAVVSNGTGTSSNLVATVSIVTPNPVIFIEPFNQIAASNGVASFTVGAYPLEATYQWYQGNTALSDVSGHWAGSQQQTLSDLNAQGSDSTNYYVVASYAGNSVTSSVASLTVETPPAFSAVPYTSGMVYQQNFDSLPDPGTTNINNTTTLFPVVIAGVAYSVANPFDFAAPLTVQGDVVGDNNPPATAGPAGGLNLPAMTGWYSSDLGNEQIQAQTGNTTTGLIISFGCTNAYNAVNPMYPTNNRALGMLSSPATALQDASGFPADAIFALRLRNLTGKTVTNFNLSYDSELWRDTGLINNMNNYFYVDPLGTNSTPVNYWTGGLTNLLFTTNQPGFKAGGYTFATNSPIAITNMAFLNVPLSTPWTEGGILWLVWEETNSISGAQGIAIDNLVFTTGTQPKLQLSQTGSSVVLSWPRMFTGYTLQSSTNLANPNNWQSVSPLPSSFDGMYLVTNTVGGLNMYYRLINP
jgi:hypothetical protein